MILKVSREDQDRFASGEPRKIRYCAVKGYFKDEIVPITVPQRRGDPIIFDTDEHPRETSMEALAKLLPCAQTVPLPLVMRVVLMTVRV